MKSVKPSVNLINYTQGAAELLIYTKNTRLTLGKDTRAKVLSMTEEEKAKELEYIANSIPSSWEFVDYTFEILDCSRAYTQQQQRTRVGVSYAQQTMRVLDVEGYDYHTGPSIEEDSDRTTMYEVAMEGINVVYRNLIKSGAKVEDARGVLPMNIATNMIMKINLAALAAMARKREGLRTQAEYRCILGQMISCVLNVHPWAKAFLLPDKLTPVRELEDYVCCEPDIELRIKLAKALDLIRQYI